MAWSGQDLQSDIERLTDELDAAVRAMGHYGKEAADAEHDYRLAIMKTITVLRDAGEPATLIKDIAKGKCAEDLQKRDFTRMYYQVAVENVNAIKLKLRLLEAQAGREWSKER